MAGGSGAPSILGSITSGLFNSIFNARLQRDSATTISLQGYKGRYVGISGELVDVAAGFSLAQSDNRIDATGADAAAALAVDTLYYVYVSNSLASFSPLGIRCSLVAPSNVNGVKLLGAAGNALNWRFVGWVRTIDNGGTPNFADSVTQRLVINYFNKLDLRMQVTPGYVDDNAPTTYTQAATAGFVAINGGTGSMLQYISNGEDAARVNLGIQANAVDGSIPDGFSIAYGVDSTVQTSGYIEMEYSAAEPAGVYFGRPTMSDELLPAEGYHEVNYLIWNWSPANVVTVYGDGGRAAGETIDEKTTWMSMTVKG